MIYLDEADVKKIGVDWFKTIGVIEKTVLCLHNNDFSQPIKPYLRYRDPQNRIIAMPAFVGGSFNAAGIKWIASFPRNIDKGIPRAHSVVILNRAETGQPYGIINTALLSIIRTASVSGLLIRHFLKNRTLENLNLGIIGWGPIGRCHLEMCTGILKDKIKKVFLYDIRKIDPFSITPELKNKVVLTRCWEEAYNDSDIFITCTVSQTPYIDKKPKEGSLQLNVSLRDYKTDIYDYVKDSIIVDDWEEVCRENTDIEMMAREKKLKKENVKSIIDVVMNGCIGDYDPNAAVMFNPMGLAVFDIALGVYYIAEAQNRGIGREL